MATCFTLLHQEKLAIRLPEEEREALQLVRLQGMTRPEAAAVICVSEKTVKRRLDRGLMLLNQALGDLAGGSPPINSV